MILIDQFMTKEELKAELQKLGVTDKEYNLYGNLVTDSIILYHSYNEWQVFYFDERGGRNNEKIFESEGEACCYIFKLFREAKAIEKKFNGGGLAPY